MLGALLRLYRSPVNGKRKNYVARVLCSFVFRGMGSTQ